MSRAVALVLALATGCAGTTRVTVSMTGRTLHGAAAELRARGNAEVETRHLPDEGTSRAEVELVTLDQTVSWVPPQPPEGPISRPTDITVATLLDGCGDAVPFAGVTLDTGGTRCRLVAARDERLTLRTYQRATPRPRASEIAGIAMLGWLVTGLSAIVVVEAGAVDDHPGWRTGLLWYGGGTAVIVGGAALITFAYGIGRCIFGDGPCRG